MLWGKEEEIKLIDVYFIKDKEELEEIFNRKYPAIYNKYTQLTNKSKVIKRKSKVYLEKCPNCGKEINEVEQGYYCKYCFHEYNSRGDYLRPIGG